MHEVEVAQEDEEDQGPQGEQEEEDTNSLFQWTHHTDTHTVLFIFVYPMVCCDLY